MIHHPHYKRVVATITAILYTVFCVLCVAHKLSAASARVNFDLQTQADVDRQYRALGELVSFTPVVIYFTNIPGRLSG